MYDMTPLIKHHLSWLREDAHLAAQWLDSLMTKISYRRYLYEPEAQPWTAEELNEMYEGAKRPSFGDRFHIIREMEETMIRRVLNYNFYIKFRLWRPISYLKKCLDTD